jgi:hypothetical protein
MDLQSTTPTITAICLGHDAYYFVPRPDVYNSDALSALDNIAADQQKESNFECVVLDSRWLHIRSRENWSWFFVGLPGLKKVWFYEHGDQFIRDKDVEWVHLKGLKEQYVIKLGEAVALSWEDDIKERGSSYLDEHRKWGVELTRRQPPEITIWEPKPQYKEI